MNQVKHKSIVIIPELTPDTTWCLEKVLNKGKNKCVLKQL